MNKSMFNLHLKECEFRFNNRKQNLYSILLEIFRKEPLMGDPELRHRMGQAGRVKIERQYSLQVTGPVLTSVIKSIVKGS